MRVLLNIPISPYSGYGGDGIGITQAFLRAGCEVSVNPVVVQPPIPQEVADLLTRPVQAPYDISITHVDPMSLEMKEENQRGAAFNIGWTMWEFSNLGNMTRRSSAHKRWQKFDALVGYDDVTCGGLKDYYSGPIIKQQGGFDPSLWPYLDRMWDDEKIRFCMIGVLSLRKDPFVAIRAFGDLLNEYPGFAGRATLSLKTTNPGLHTKMEDVYPGLRVFYEAWPTDVVREFYRANHVLLAPSRGEGKNLPALEFLSTGGVVAATNWGGHTEWLDEDYSFPIDYTLEPVEDFPQTLNARASVEHLKKIMIFCFENRNKIRDMGAVGSRVVPTRHSWDAVIHSLMQKIGQVNDKGFEVFDKFIQAKAF